MECGRGGISSSKHYSVAREQRNLVMLAGRGKGHTELASVCFPTQKVMTDCTE